MEYNTIKTYMQMMNIKFPVQTCLGKIEKEVVYYMVSIQQYMFCPL